MRLIAYISHLLFSLSAVFGFIALSEIGVRNESPSV